MDKSPSVTDMEAKETFEEGKTDQEVSVVKVIKTQYFKKSYEKTYQKLNLLMTLKEELKEEVFFLNC